MRVKTEAPEMATQLAICNGTGTQTVNADAPTQTKHDRWMRRDREEPSARPKREPSEFSAEGGNSGVLDSALEA